MYTEMIFERKNKQYGAYDLRVNYEARLIRAFLIGCLLAGMAILLPKVMRWVFPRPGARQSDPPARRNRIRQFVRLCTAGKRAFGSSKVQCREVFHHSSKGSKRLQTGCKGPFTGRSCSCSRSGGSHTRPRAWQSGHRPSWSANSRFVDLAGPEGLFSGQCGSRA